MAFPNDMSRIAAESSKLAGSNSDYTSPKLAARSLIRRSITIPIASVAANGVGAVVPNANPAQYRAPFPGRVLTGHFVPSLAATANASNYANMTATITQANGVGVGRDVATQTTKPTANGGVGTLAPGAPVALTVTDDANARFAKGEVLSGTVTMTASGVAMGAGAIQYLVEMEGSADDVGV